MNTTVDTAVRVTPARTRAEVSAFIRMPYRIYRDDPHWVAPLERERRAFLDRGRNPFFAHADAELFLARRGRLVVGRIAAVHNRQHNAFHHTTDGFFGMFECDRDPAAATALLGTAAGWLRARGLTTVLGPASFSTNHECGLLVTGFDDPPLAMMPYNPPYYAELVEQAGFVPAKDLLSWHLPTTGQPAGVARVAQAARDRAGVRVRPVALRRFHTELAAIREIYNAAWADNWGFTPMSDPELAHLARALRPAIRPELALIAEVHGEPAGFALVLPDVNQALRPARGRLATCGVPIGLLRMATAARRINRVRVVAVGIKSDYRRQGLDAILYVDLVAACRRLGLGVEAGWTLEDNTPANQFLIRMGARHTRTHRMYTASCR